ncbi:MAG: hypothetical protein M1834_005496 [Cirrosporium novae-zelandiae]|nr:MAG: hypothetical protein M1834_005496 [Cirrosporium novae-zelandiae]
MSSQLKSGPLEASPEGKSCANITTEAGSDTGIIPGSVIDLENSDDNGWRRSLTARQVVMLSIGGGIGTGLWVGTGTALAKGGPGACAIGYILVAIAIYIEFMSIGEMTCYKPLYGGYIRQTMEYVDKAAAFALGMNYWFAWVLIIPAEIIACVSVLQYWPITEKIPIAGYITIFLVFMSLFNIFEVKWYGHVEVVMNMIKVTALMIIMFFMVIMTSGGIPATHGPIEFRYWKDPGAFPNGFKGICKAVLQAAFSCTSAGYIAVCAGEMINPRRTIKKAIQPLFWRMVLFYVVNIWLVTMCVPWNDPDLNNKSGTLASPFIIAVKRAGVPVLADILNGLILITVTACGITAIYIASRALTSMSELGIIHPIFSKKDTRGRPRLALIVSGTLGGGLTYLNCNDTAQVVYSWLSSLVGVSAFLGWALIYISHLRFRAGLRAQGIDHRSLPFYSWMVPWGQYLGLVLCFCFLAAELYFALWPFGGEPSAEGFFSTYISPPLFAIDFLLYKWYFKTKFVRGKDMNFRQAEWFDEFDRKKAEEIAIATATRTTEPRSKLLLRFWKKGWDVLMTESEKK